MFYDMNDIAMEENKERSSKGQKFGEDRAPTEEIRKIIEYPGKRSNSMHYVIIRRVGAWDFAKFKHVVSLRRDGKIVAAKLIVYAGEDDDFTFISSEAYYELVKWRHSVLCLM